MTKYQVNYELGFTYEVEAKTEADAQADADKLFEKELSEGLTSVSPNVSINRIDSEELCPRHAVKLVSKMFDIDGTNLVEHEVCPKCGYGSPELN